MAELLAGLIQVNLATAAATLLALALRGPVRRGFGAGAAYALWIAVPLAAAATLMPQPLTGTALDPIVLTAGAAAERAIPKAASDASVLTALFALWLGGALATFALLAWRQGRFVASLGRLERLSARELRSDRSGIGPAVLGALRPQIVTPADFEARFGLEERGVILAHEAVHLDRGDPAINALAAALQCVGWFNPLVHLGVHRMRIDQELACDAAVLARFPDARRLYAETLLKTQLCAQPLPLGCHWPAGSEHPLKERIAMLKQPLPGRVRRTLGVAAVAALSLGGAAAAWAAQAPIKPALITAPDWIRRPTPADVAWAYPADAKAQNLNGMAMITCRVDKSGKLNGCAVVKETPAGAGFGPAALALADSFQMKPLTKNGAPTGGGEVRIPFKFMIPAAPAQ